MSKRKYKARLEGSGIIVPRVKSDSMEDLKRTLQSWNRDRVARWRPLAEKYEAGYLLDQAEALLDDHGQPKDAARFGWIMDRAELKIVKAANEKELIPLAEKGKKFKPSDERKDALSKLMWFTLLDMMSESGRQRFPTAKELWDTLPCEDSIQEKETDERVIYWLYPNGKGKTTPFKRFQDRNTTLRKKFKKMSL